MAQRRTDLDDIPEFSKRLAGADRGHQRLFLISSFRGDQNRRVGIDVFLERVGCQQGVFRRNVEAWKPFLPKILGEGHESPAIGAKDPTSAFRA